MEKAIFKDLLYRETQAAFSQEFSVRNGVYFKVPELGPLDQFHGENLRGCDFFIDTRDIHFAGLGECSGKDFHVAGFPAEVEFPKQALFYLLNKVW